MQLLRFSLRKCMSVVVTFALTLGLVASISSPASAATTWSSVGPSSLPTLSATQPMILWSHVWHNELLYIVRNSSGNYELRTIENRYVTPSIISLVPSPYNSSNVTHTFSWVEHGGYFFFNGANATNGIAIYKYNGGGTASLAVDVNTSSTSTTFGAYGTGSLFEWKNELWFVDENVSGTANTTNGLYHWDWTSSTAKLAPATALSTGAAATTISNPTLFNNKVYYRIGAGLNSTGSWAGAELYSFDGYKVELAANLYPEAFSGTNFNSGDPTATSANTGLNASGSASGCNFDGNNAHFVTTSEYLAFYAKSNSTNTYELWVLDTSGNVTNLHGKDPGALANPNPDCLVNYNDSLYFTGSYDTSIGYELYKVTGGTSPAVSLVTDITSGSGSTFISSIRADNGKLYYYVNADGIYTYDGSISTRIVTVPATGNYNLQAFAPYNGAIWAVTSSSSTPVLGTANFDGATGTPTLASKADVTVSAGEIIINPPAVTVDSNCSLPIRLRSIYRHPKRQNY
jgi:hypothetical protein